MKHLVLIDGHHLMYRAYWAIPRTLKTRSGEQSNTSFGMASMLLAILQKEEPDAFVICFDEGDKTFRHEEHDEYKDGRAETPDDFYVQIPRVMELVDSFGFAKVSDPKFEADDFLCTYARAGEAAGMKVTVVTGDKDALQLATDKIQIAIPHKGYNQAEYLGPKEIEEKYGIRPDQVASYKGLCGDSSDNLPGVQGIGPKTAAQLLQEHDTLKGVYEHLDDIRPAVAEKLRRDKEQAFFCERMAELISDVPLPYSLDEVMLTDMDVTHVLNFFTEMDFTMLSRRLIRFLETDYAKQHFITDNVTMPGAKNEKSNEPDNQLSLFQ